jgi:hypothetical protein
MADPKNIPGKDDQSERLSERIENHRREIQFLVKQGGEQPQYEFKRKVLLSREHLDERLDFVKLIQSVANAEIAKERCIVIGADPKEKTFHPVANTSDFDAANLSKILSTYLEPLPRFEVFTLTTDTNNTFVLISLDANQPRPIVVAKAGQTEKGKTRLELGDVWIKRNTDTVRANRADLDLMYKVRTEEEAEDRARKRLKHLLERASPQQPQVSTTVVPTFALLIGPKHELRIFTEELIAANDLGRFQMLLEVGRETLVEGWDKFDVRVLEFSQSADELTSGLTNFYANQFIPVLESVVELALIVVKHNASLEWMSAAIGLMLESFDVSRNLRKFPMASLFPTSSPVLPWWKPAFELFMGIRVIAVYSVVRNKLGFLAEILPRIVTWDSQDGMVHWKTPILFWPFRPSPFQSREFDGGRAHYFWNQRIGAAWANYYGNFTKFAENSAQLELLLEFNSYLGTNTLKDSKLGDWLKANVSNETGFEYVPDLYSDDLHVTVPMAERLYEVVAKGSPYPVHLFVDPRMPIQVFGSLSEVKRLEMYGRFLHHVKVWQKTFMFQALRRLEFMWDWDGRLGTIARASQSQNPGK